MGAGTSAEQRGEPGTEWCQFDVSQLPHEVVWQVLLLVPARDVVTNCSRVCKLWYTMCKDIAFWHRRCRQEGKYSVRTMGQLQVDFAKVCIRNPLMRNLLKNTRALEGLTNWTTQENCPNPQIEESPNGADPVTDYITPSEGQVYNWVASYTYTSLTQQVSFIDEGCSEELMDNTKPPIEVSVWCAARCDCGVKFRVTVELKDVKSQVLDTFDKVLVITDTADRRVWHKLEHTFMDYRPGVRVATFTMGGVDTQFWAGNYGPKFTLPCVRFAWDKLEKKN